MPRCCLRGDTAGPEFVTFTLDPSDHILAVMSVRLCDVLNDFKPLIHTGTPVDRRDWTDPSVEFSAL